MPIRSFSRLALVLVVLFAILVAGSLFPFQPFDPLWQGRLIAALVNSATLPLVALALLHLAVLLDPSDPRLQRRYQRFCTFAAAAALGFLLLVPLQVATALRQQKTSSTEQVQRLQQAERKLNQFRSALAQASSGADLSARLQQLNGPALSPADLALPLPVLKAQVANVFTQAQNQLARERAALAPNNPLLLLPQLLRGCAACLALAFGFAIFATRPGKEIPLLDELQLSLQSSRNRRANKSSQAVSQEAYIRQLHGEDEG